MKKLSCLLILMIVMGCFVASVFAGPSDQSQTSTVNANIGQKFSLAFYAGALTTGDPNPPLYSSTIPFTSVDPSNQYNYPDGRAQGDGKSDIGLVAISNYNVAWYLKIQAADITGNLAGHGNLYLYMSQPTNRNTSTAAGGSLG